VTADLHRLEIRQLLSASTRKYSQYRTIIVVPRHPQNRKQTVQYLAGVGAEVLDDESGDDRRAVVGVLAPRQPNAGRSQVADGGLGRRAGVGGRLRRPAEDDVVVGGRLDDERGTGRRLAGLTQSLARVPARVALPQLCATVVHPRRF